jgi:hypothetical protein
MLYVASQQWMSGLQPAIDPNFAGFLVLYGCLLYRRNAAIDE